MPGPAGSAFSGGRGSNDTIWIEMPDGGKALGHIRDAGRNLQWQMDKTMSFLADDMVVVAKDLVAKDEHKVEKSIRAEKRGDGWVIVADRGGERDAVAIYLEIGTHKMAARPYLVPASRLVLSSGGLLKATKQAGGLLGRTNI
jgi:hypothetical protein